MIRRQLAAACWRWWTASLAGKLAALALPAGAGLALADGELLALFAVVLALLLLLLLLARLDAGRAPHADHAGRRPAEQREPASPSQGSGGFSAPPPAAVAVAAPRRVLDFDETLEALLGYVGRRVLVVVGASRVGAARLHGVLQGARERHDPEGLEFDIGLGGDHYFAIWRRAFRGAWFDDETTLAIAQEGVEIWLSTLRVYAPEEAR